MLDQYQHRPDHPSLTTMLCSTPQCQTHSTQEAPPFFVSSVPASIVSIIASSTSSFRLSFPISPFQLSLSPSSLLPLVAFDASPFVPTVPAFFHLLHLTFLDSGGTASLPLRFYSLIFSLIPHRHQKFRRSESKKLESRGPFLGAAICPS